MSTNGNGKWFCSTWDAKRKGVRLNIPKNSGWYAARPECCELTVKVFIYDNLLDCYVEGNDNKYDVYDFNWWYPLKTPHDRLPDFK